MVEDDNAVKEANDYLSGGIDSTYAKGGIPPSTLFSFVDMTKPNMYSDVTRVYCLYDADTMGLNKIE